MAENSLLTRLRIQSSVDDVKSPSFWKACLSEFVGTFILCFIGFCTVQSTNDLLTIAIGFGLAGALGIWLTAPVSGGNINPAVSIGLLFARQISLIRFFCYSIFQIFGSMAASGLCFTVTGNNTKSVVNQPVVSSHQSFLFEVTISCLLVFTVMRMCVEKCRSDSEKGVAALAIGFSILVGILAAANISSGSMNPARSIGPAIIEYKIDYIWIYLFGPLLGGICAAFLQQFMFTSEMSGKFVQDFVADPYFENKEEKEKLPEQHPLTEFA